MSLAPGIGISDIFGSSPLSFLLRDLFTTAVAAGSIDGTDAEPGPGSRTVVDSGNHLSIAGGFLVGDGQSGAGDPRLMYGSIARSPGLLLKFHLSIGDNRYMVGIFDRSAPTSYNYLLAGIADWSGAHAIFIGGKFYRNFSLSTSTDYQFACVLRASGAFVFMIGGSLSNWILLAYHSASTASPVFPGYAARVTDFTFTSDFFRIPNKPWLPLPVVSDGFTDDDSTALASHSTDGLGHAEGVAGGLGIGGDGLAWTEQNGDWEIQSNAAVPAGSSPGGAGWVATLDSGKADVIGSVEVTTGTAGSSAGLVLRYSDNDNFWMAVLHNASDNFQIYERVGGSMYSRASVSVTINDDTTYEIKSFTRNEYIFAILNNTDSYKLSYSSASGFKTCTKHGLRSVSGIESFDNLVIYPTGSDNEYAVLSSF